MLLYNHKKEFVGIDETALRALGFASVADMRAQAVDFADLFIKTPGYIHNFRHVHWIDYIACGEGGVEAKAIIQAKEQKFTTSIAIKTIYLMDNPAQKAFVVELLNIKPLSQKQEAQISSPAQPIEQRVVPPTVTPLKKEPIYENLSPSIIKDPYEEQAHEETYEAPKPKDITLHLDDLLTKEPSLAPQKELKPEHEQKPLAKEAQITPSLIVQESLETQEQEDPFVNYVFDPHTASHDLGLPIDLVEEFVQDFIAQAKSFKEELYNALHNGHMDILKIQSHKLKGVAANLRIEDALDALKIINSSHDEYEIKTNLDRFYAIISKLTKEEEVAVNLQPKEEEKEQEEDVLVLSFKDETPQMLPIVSEELSVQEETQEDKEALESIPEEKTLSYDKKSVAHEIGLDLQSFRELFEDYLTEAKEIVQTIQNGAQKGELTICKNGAVKLKGMNENMRMHHFDASLEGILNASDATRIEEFTAQINEVLTLISKEEDK